MVIDNAQHHTHTHIYVQIMKQHSHVAFLDKRQCMVCSSIGECMHLESPSYPSIKDKAMHFVPIDPSKLTTIMDVNQVLIRLDEGNMPFSLAFCYDQALMQT